MSYGHLPPEPALVEPSPDSRKSMLIGFGVIAGVFVLLVLIAVVVLAAPLIKSMFGSSSSGSDSNYRIAELAEEPEQLWQYRYEAASESYVESTPTLVAVGDDAILTMNRFDYMAWADEHENFSWYEGFSEHYSAGYEGAVRYEEAMAQYDLEVDSRQFGDPYPDFPDYFEFWDESWDGYGYSVGWEDGMNGLPEGENDIAPPEDPQWKAQATLIDAKTAEELWTISLTDMVDDFDFRRTVYPQWIEGTNVIVFPVTTSTGDEDGETELIAVSTRDGEVLSRRTVGVESSWTQDDGDLIVLELTRDPETFERNPGTLFRVDGASLESDPKWSQDDVDPAMLAVLNGYLFVYAHDGGHSMVLDAHSGEPAGWGRDIWYEYDTGVFYEPVGNTIIRMDAVDVYASAGRGGRSLTSYMYKDYSDGFIELSAINDKGDRAWDRSVEVGMSYIVDGHLIVGEVSTRTGYIEDLQRLDPRNGEPMWDSPSYEAFSELLLVVDDVLLAVDGDRERIVAIELDSGEVRHTERAEWVGQGIFVSDKQFYIPDSERGRLSAYSVKEQGSVWDMRYNSDDQHLTRMGDRLMLVDVDRRTLNLLG